MMKCHYSDQSSASDWSCREGNLLQPIRNTTQIWVVTRHQYGISPLVPGTSFRLKLVAGLRNVACFLRLHFPSSYCFHHVLKVIGLRWQDWAWNKVILSYFFPLQRSGGFLRTVSTSVVLRAYLRLNKRRSNSIQWKSRRTSTVSEITTIIFLMFYSFEEVNQAERWVLKIVSLPPFSIPNDERIKLY